MEVSQNTHYAIDNHITETFELSNLIYIIADNYGLDVDRLLDLCYEHSLDVSSSIEVITFNLIKSLNAYDKSKLFYQFVHRQKETINHLIRELMVDHSELKLSDVVNNQAYINWKKTFRKVFNMLKSNLYFSFNDIIKTEYMRLQIRNDKALSYSQKIYREYSKNRQFSAVDSRRTFGSITTTSLPNSYIDVNSTHTTSSTTYTITSSASNWYGNEQSLNWENLLTGNGYQHIVIPRNINFGNEHTSIQTRTYLPSKIQISDEGKSRLKKSFKGLTKFLKKDEYHDLFINNELIIEGINWNFKISFYNRKDIITYSENINNFSIPYNLELLTKNNNYVSSICIVYPGCPILDEILSTILLIKSGQENLIITTGNHFKQSKLYQQYFQDTKLEERYSEQMDLLVMNMDFIKAVLRISLSNILDGDERDYIFETDTTWSETIGYQAFNLFNVKVFDKHVNKLNWCERPYKFNLLETKEKLILGENNGKNNFSKLCW